MTESSRPTFLIIDGYGFVFRAFFAMPPLTDPSGRPVGAVYGFIKMITRLLDNPGVTHVCVALDHGKKSFRNAIYSEYKAHRPPAPDELRVQFPIIREACVALGIPAIEKEGYEADDIIACLARRAETDGMRAVVVSSDKDLMQLVTDNIVLYDPVKGKFSGPGEVVEKTGVAPHLIGDYLALTGDVADNVPGVPGIGPKTASALLTEYGDLQQILDNAPDIKQKKRREMLIEHRDNALLSRQLVALDEQACTEINPDTLLRKDDHRDSLRAFCVEMGFKSLVREIDISVPSGHIDVPGAAPEQIFSESDFTYYPEPTDFIAAVRALPQSEHPLALDLFIHGSRTYATYAMDKVIAVTEYTTTDILQCFADILQKDTRETTAFDTKALLRLCYKHTITCIPSTHEDAGLLSYVSGVQGGHTPESIIARDYDGAHMAVPDKKSEDDAVRLYAAFRVRALAASIRALRCRAEEKRVMRIYRRLEQPLQIILAKAETSGVHIDIPALNELTAQFHTKADALQTRIYAEAGEEFNIGSPKQLGVILFEKLGLTAGKKTGKSKQFTTNAETLEELAAQGADIAADVLQWRHYSKLIGTYTEALPKLADENSRIHTTFSMISANTGRLSSVNPNIQNIPVRSEDGSAIRRAFTVPKGKKLISADYSQIELRLLAHIAEMDSLKRAFSNDEDIHAATAAEIFGVPKDQITPELRRRAKTVNFGIIYGISAYGLATRLRVSQQEAKEIIARYFERYPGIRSYMERAKNEAKEHNAIRTMFGRVCPIPDIASSNYAVRAFGERAAINAPLQGAAADIIKRAMIAADTMLTTRFPQAKCVLQVHDELLIETPENIAEDVAVALVAVMEQAAQLSVPLKVEAGIGDCWADAH